jgi:hypothetical protein
MVSGFSLIDYFRQFIPSGCWNYFLTHSSESRVTQYEVPYFMNAMILEVQIYV